MSRVELAKIKSLTFYKDEQTTYRRTSPLPQLKCIGKPCKLYTPEAIRCVNVGGDGVDIDWKCEADLPESLRFGRVEVGCEGYSRPGDPYVLKGSCALEYKLVQVPGALRNGNTDSNIHDQSWKGREIDASAAVFWVIWVAILCVIAYSILKSCFDDNDDRRRVFRGGNNNNNRRPGPGGGWGGGWFGGGGNNYPRAPPPPYSKAVPPSNDSSSTGWRPGFWTGTVLGGLANQMWNNSRRQPVAPQPAPQEPYNWERNRRWSPLATTDEPAYRRARPARNDDDNRGEGSSNLGAMRSSTGIGGTNVR